MRLHALTKTWAMHDKINGGSLLQVLVTKEVAEANGMALHKLSATGTSVLIEGELAATPEGTKQVAAGAQI